MLKKIILSFLISCFVSIVTLHYQQSQTDLEVLLGGTSSTTASVPTEDRTDGAECSERGEGGEPSEDEAEWAKRVAIAVIDFAKCWMQFVVERCDRGRGLRPR